ncbi:hypothetical protein H5410_051623 [Solanum commersonii]|uniref:Uncharacterized protein n=1 Tax=Solanum commersonii TaxID=4109 RepID=A0A9J5X132_SOLCO|nr:hypothetical protein H5410_051623 [Solanum commersonii]
MMFQALYENLGQSDLIISFIEYKCYIYITNLTWWQLWNHLNKPGTFNCIKEYYGWMQITMKMGICEFLLRKILWWRKDLFYRRIFTPSPRVHLSLSRLIMKDEEKIGGLPIYHNEMEDFSCCINSYKLVDINFKGCPLTLWNGRPDQGSGSDHAPMLLSYGIHNGQFHTPFKCLNFWIEKEHFKQVVLQTVMMLL